MFLYVAVSAFISTKKGRRVKLLSSFINNDNVVLEEMLFYNNLVDARTFIQFTDHERDIVLTKTKANDKCTVNLFK